MSKRLLETANQKRGRSSKVKGASGERELAHFLQDLLGINSRRGRQFCGREGAPDVVVDETIKLDGIDGLHIECKRVEKLNLYNAITQSKSDARTGEIPIVCHRQNNKKWLLSVELEELPKLARWVLAALEKGETDGCSSGGDAVENG